MRLISLFAFTLLTVACVMADVTFNVATGNDYRVLKAGEEEKLALVLKNDVAEDVDVTVEYQMVDLAGNLLLKDSCSKTIPANGEVQIAMKAPELFGAYYVRCAVNGMQDVRLVAPVRFAYMKPAGPMLDLKDTFIMGSGEHYESYPADELEQMTAMAELAGIGFIRTDVRWHRLEPKKGEWNFSYFDQAMDMFDRHHIGVLAILHNGAKWTHAADWVPAVKTNHNSWAARPEYEYWRNYMRKFAEHYKGRFKYVEILNEINAHIHFNYTPEEYANQVHIAMEELKAVDPEIVVSLAGLASLVGNLTPVPNYFERFFKALDGKFDYFAVHQHGPFEAYETEYTTYMAPMHRKYCPDRGWWNTECGESLADVQGELAQAETLFKKLLYTWAQKGKGYFWYNFRCKPLEDFPAGSGEPFFGLVMQDMQPRPSFIAFNTLNTILRGADFVEDANAGKAAGEDVYAYTFKTCRENEYAMTIFRTEKANTLQLVSGVTGRAFLVDLFGNRTELDVKDGNIAFPLDSHPCFVSFLDQTETPVLKGVFLESENLILYPGAKQEFSYIVHNPTTEPMEAELVMVVPSGMSISPETQSVVVPSEKSAEVKFEFVTSLDYHGKTLGMNVKAGDMWNGNLMLQAKTAVKIPSEFQENASLVIDQKEQQVQIILVEASTEEFFWKGPQDCSATVWMAQNNYRLKMKIEVMDDEHCPNADDMTKGDYVEIDIQIPRQDVFWEIGLRHNVDGDATVAVLALPHGFISHVVTSRIAVQSQRVGNLTTYDVVIPFNAIGITPGIGKTGFKMNIKAADCDDGITMEGFMAIAPVLEKSPEKFSQVCF